MSNVVEFPKSKNLRRQLDEQLEELETIFNAINQGYSLLEQLEEGCTKAEAKFNGLLASYGKAVGVENIELKYLEYASENLTIDIETGEIRLEITEEENEEV